MLDVAPSARKGGRRLLAAAASAAICSVALRRGAPPDAGADGDGLAAGPPGRSTRIPPSWGVESLPEANVVAIERASAEEGEGGGDAASAALSSIPDLTDAFRRGAHLESNATAVAVVVTVFDVEYARAFANFVAMCSIHGLDNVVGLALSRDALEMASLDVRSAGVPAEFANVIYDDRLASYVEEARGQHRWHRIGHAKLLLTLAGLEAGRRIFVIEIDVVLLKDPHLQFPADGPYDVISMFCPTTKVNNKINLGFQLWTPTNRTLPFFRGVVDEAARRQSWDQGVLNLHYHNGGGEKPIRLAPLPICVPDPHWDSGEAMPSFVERTYEAGSVRRAAAEQSHTAIHVVGKKTLSKVEWMAQSHALEVEPYGAESFVMLEGTATTRGGYLRAVRALFALGEALDRVPVLPHPGEKVPVHKYLDVASLRECGGGYKAAPFLNGHLFLNRTEVPDEVRYCGVDSSASRLRQLPRKNVLVLTPAEGEAGGTCDAAPATLSDEDRDILARTSQRAGVGGSWDESSLSSFLERFDLTGSRMERVLSCVNASTLES